MPIPTYQEMMLPLLRVLDAAGKELHQKEYSSLTADALGLSEEQREERLPSGLQTYVFNRAGWAGWYMQQAGLVEKPKKGHLRITEEGRKLLATNPAVIDNKVLSAYPSFVEKMTKAPSGGTSPGPEIVPPGTQTPTEQIEQAELKLRAQLASDLLDLMSRMDPYRFEQLVVDLLFAMGYGGSRAEAAQVTQKSNDGGIDGIISEDRLGLDVIYVQAKRWQSTVGREPIQSFVGALAGKHATKGVFITTSDFHKNALDYAKGVTHKIILINGQRLAELMIEYGVGVSTVRTIALKRVDSDYFEDA
ncbi:restriction endonuclease [Prosthecobacter sp.]|jgi:restriction system protein|uniref:restriction endonuclease n=1 Tax=Prosthecobacter sp. TaxID=1965333 RepID=UPI0037C878A6